MAVGLALTAAGWTSDSSAWTWILLLSGFAIVAWGVRRMTQAEQTKGAALPNPVQGAASERADSSRRAADA